MEQEEKSKAIKNRRVCFNCGRPINNNQTIKCICGSEDIDDRRARPKKTEPQKIEALPHPWNHLELREGGSILLSGNKGSGKTSICIAIKPYQIASTEQEIQEVAHAWYRILPDSEEPFLTSVYSWEDLENDVEEVPKGKIIIIDSISQLTTGPESAEIMKRIIEKIRLNGAIAIFIAQFTKDGSMLGPNQLNHMVDVVCTIPDDDLGMRRLSASKNRFGSLFSQYFALTSRGVERQDFEKYAYTVEGSAGNYSLRLYPMKPSKFGGIFEALEENGIMLEGMASAAIRCKGYRTGFAEASDAEWRRKFAEDHGLKWVSPEDAQQLILEARANESDPREME